MSKTVVLLNPYGTDVTPYVNHTSGYAQLMSGTVAASSDTVYTLPYNNNVSTAANITSAAGLLDTKLNGTSGQILVFGYSEGCQIADYWLSNQALTTSVSPSNVSFLLIGNANRKYGGFAYNRSIFNGVGYTGGKPDNTPFTVVDFVRQYDPIGDFPTATPIVNALVGLSTVGSDKNAYTGAMQDVAAIMASTPYSNAVSNAVVGLAIIHTGLGIASTGYMSVTVSDATNVSLADGNITWVWSPTYPVPMLGFGGTFPQTDLQLRTQIEQAYSRPVSIPMPNYGKNTGWGVEPFPLPVSPPPVTGWWAELHVSVHITIQPSVTTSSGHHAHATIVTTVSVTAVAHSVHPVTASKTVTPSVTAHVTLVLPVTVAKTVTPSVTGSIKLIKLIAAAITVHPTVSSVSRDRDGVTIAVTPTVTSSVFINGHVVHVAKTVTPSVTTSGMVTRFGTEAIFVQPTVSAAAVVHKFASVTETVTPTVTTAGGVTRHATAAITATPTVTSGVRGEVHTTTTVTPTVTATAVVTRVGAVAKTVTPAVSTVWLLTRYANAALTVTPSVSGVVRDRDGASITVSPSVAVVGHAVKSKSASLTITPAVTVSARVVASVSKTVTPTVSPVSRTRVSEAITATPSVAATAGKMRFGNQAITVAPSVSAAALAAISKSINVTPTVTTAASVSAGVAYDNSSISAHQSSKASGSAFTWSHTGASGAYAIVAVYSDAHSSSTTTAATATVTYGGTAMTSLGNISLNNATADGFLWVFGLATPPSGAQTVSVKFTQSSHTFTGWATAFTYTGVSSVGTLQTATGASTSPSVSVTAASTDIVWGAITNYQSIVSSSNAMSAFSLTNSRQTQNSGTNYPYFVAGDTTGSTSVTVSATISASDPWAAVGLDLQ